MKNSRIFNYLQISFHSSSFKIIQIFEVVYLDLDYLNYFNDLTMLLLGFLNREEPVLFQNFKEWVSPYLNS